jgi:hypothetical protein
MLQVIEGAAVGDRGDQRAELQRGHRDALAEAAHASDAAGARAAPDRDRRRGFRRGCCSRRVRRGRTGWSSGGRARSRAAAEGLEIEIVGVGQRLGEGQVVAAAEIDRSVLGDDAFLKRGEGDGNLDGGAGLGAAAQGQLLVDHGENAAVAGVDRDDGAVHIAERIDRRRADDRIFAPRNIGRGWITLDKGVTRKALISAMMAIGSQARPMKSRRPAVMCM